MSLLRKLDSAILALCTRTAHRFQLLTGRTNFFIAKIGILLSTIDVTLRIVGYFFPSPHIPRSMFMVGFGFFYLVSAISQALILDEADRRAPKSSERAAIPGITGASSFGRRMLWLFFLVIDTITVFIESGQPGYNLIDVLITVAFTDGLLIFYYFVEVEPLRPQKSLLQKLVEKFSFSMGTPVPVQSKG